MDGTMGRTALNIRRNYEFSNARMRISLQFFLPFILPRFSISE
jgi:hypothetical protein